MRTSNRNSRKTAAKVVASVALVAGAASVAGLGTFGAFTSSTAATQEVSNGRIAIGLAEGVQGSTIAAAGLVPGDTVERTMTLTRDSATETFGKVTLTTVGTGSKLTTDTALGLQMTVDQCATPWVKTGESKALTCATAPVTVLASAPVIGSLADLGTANLDALNTAGSSHLRVTLALPEAADNDFQKAADSVKFTFDATQRDAQSR
ncbi:TasA family protein [Nocardioides abyssi]|uniref:TasA family protein n=1 Tax=Nocardioides abyssi TaxID=3058370 RepID=A0ABT8EUF2_9ACTN|nr:TasA family protein [Nocardioides abyssi]MDN4161805.1 TasA family protein [Nocardioides abyssi]